MPARCLLIVQPYLTAYRLPVFVGLTRYFDRVVLASSPAPDGSAYGSPDISGSGIRQHVLLPEWRFLGGRLHWQRGLLALIWRERPSQLLITANPRALSTWAALGLCRVLGIPCYGHGQGLYDKPSPPGWLVLAYRLLTAWMRVYIAYTASGVESLRRVGVRAPMAVAENSLCLTAATTPAEKTGRERGILFVGRLREGCRIELLIDAVEAARQRTGQALMLHIVGEGPLHATAAHHEWVHWHGGTYDHAAIRNIARDCRVGCYPGDAGLSVVHYMGLSLVPVIHDRLDLHMGPEPSYVVDGDNGRRFAHDEALPALTEVLCELFTQAPVQALSARAHATYCALNEPPLAERIARILKGDSETSAAKSAC